MHSSQFISNVFASQSQNMGPVFGHGSNLEAIVCKQREKSREKFYTVIYTCMR